MALSAREMGEAIIRNMKEKTGRSLGDWIEAIPGEIAGDRRRVVSWLKEEHGLGHFQAVTVYESSQGKSEYDDRAGIEKKLFGRADAALARIYRTLEQEIISLGADVESIACRTYIPFRRKRQFAVLAPHRGALRLGLALGQEPLEPPFEPAKALGGSDRITHSVTLDPAAAGVTEEIKSAIRRAYEING